MIMSYYWGLGIGHTYAHNFLHLVTSASHQHPIEEIEENNKLSLSPNHTLEVLPCESTGNELEFSLNNLEDDIAQLDTAEEDHDSALCDHGDVSPINYKEMYIRN